MYRLTFSLLLLISCMGLSFGSAASIKAYQFESVEQEKRFNRLNTVLRCPTCQNQNLTDSNSMVADDLKQIVYEKLIAGDSDEEILSFMKQRYGEFILYQPELNRSNVFLWAGPLIFMLVLLVSFITWYRRNKTVVGDE